MNCMFCKRCGVCKVSKHYGVGHGSVPFRPLFLLEFGVQNVFIVVSLRWMTNIWKLILFWFWHRKLFYKKKYATFNSSICEPNMSPNGQIYTCLAYSDQNNKTKITVLTVNFCHMVSYFAKRRMNGAYFFFIVNTFIFSKSRVTWFWNVLIDLNDANLKKNFDSKFQ